LEALIFYFSSSLELAGKGLFPERSKKVMIPNDQMSTFSEYIYLLTISGAV